MEAQELPISEGSPVTYDSDPCIGDASSGDVGESEEDEPGNDEPKHAAIVMLQGHEDVVAKLSSMGVEDGIAMEVLLEHAPLEEVNNVAEALASVRPKKKEVLQVQRAVSFNVQEEVPKWRVRDVRQEGPVLDVIDPITDNLVKDEDRDCNSDYADLLDDPCVDYPDPKERARLNKERQERIHARIASMESAEIYPASSDVSIKSMERDGDSDVVSAQVVNRDYLTEVEKDGIEPADEGESVQEEGTQHVQIVTHDSVGCNRKDITSEGKGNKNEDDEEVLNEEKAENVLETWVKRSTIPRQGTPERSSPHQLCKSEHFNSDQSHPTPDSFPGMSTESSNPRVSSPAVLMFDFGELNLGKERNSERDKWGDMMMQEKMEWAGAEQDPSAPAACSSSSRSSVSQEGSASGTKTGQSPLRRRAMERPGSTVFSLIFLSPCTIPFQFYSP